MGKTINAYRILAEKPEGKKPLGRPRLGGRILLRWMLKKQYVSGQTGFI
jgi:hypothetical protein